MLVRCQAAVAALLARLQEGKRWEQKQECMGVRRRA